MYHQRRAASFSDCMWGAPELVFVFSQQVTSQVSNGV
jgi:hypothetical protein